MLYHNNLIEGEPGEGNRVGRPEGRLERTLTGQDMADRRSSENMASQSRADRPFEARYLWVMAGCAAAMAASYLLGYQHVQLPTGLFLPAHLVLEFSSIVVTFAVFTTGWFGYRQTHNARDLVVGVTFLVAGVLDFIHTLSYRGMPDFLGHGGAGKAAAYWLAARLVVGVGLLAAGLILPGPRRSRRFPAFLVTGAAAGTLLLITLFTLYQTAVAGAVYDEANGLLTALKNGLEYLIIVSYVTAFFVNSARRGWEAHTVRLLRSALIVAAWAEAAFTLYASPYDWINLLGHLLKIVAYYLILNALFVSALERPWTELSAAKEELQELYQDARAHRREIEKSFGRIGSALSAGLQVHEALDRIAELASDMLHADCSIVVVWRESGQGVGVRSQRGGCHEASRPTELTVNLGKQSADSGSSILVNDIAGAGLVDCDFSHDNCLRSVICSPMVWQDEQLGAVAIYSHVRDAFNEGDVALLEGFASHAAVAVRNAMSFERESHIADVLQRSLLTGVQTRVGRFEIEHIYEPATRQAMVGGDFYDVIGLGEGRVGLAIGDVSGKGLEAAVHTAMVKYTLRAYVRQRKSPAEALRLLNEAVADLTASDTFITMFYGELDTETGELVYANAGHEPPLYAFEGTYRELSSTGPALGMGIDLPYDEARLSLQPGSVLLLYTDGVSEARRDGEVLGSQRIGEILLSCNAAVSAEVATCVYNKATEFAQGRLTDAAAILAVRAH